MDKLLSSRGLAALAWLSTFAALWMLAMGNFKLESFAFQAMTLLVFSLIVAILASATASRK